MSEFLSLSFDQRKNVWAMFQKILVKFPHRESEGTQNENVLGNYLFNSQNAYLCFESTGLRDCAYCYNVRGATDCYDIDRWGNPAELCLEGLGVGEGARNTLFSYFCWNRCENLLYCTSCHKSKNCFGCVGIRNAQYCILNKQYSQEEYNVLVPRIIDAMRKNGEWGQFFPRSLSVFGYNETVADEFYPLNQVEAKQRGWNWRNDTEQESYLGPKGITPGHIHEVDDEICKKILICEATGKPYKIIPQELDFYRKYRLPLPRRCPDKRHRDRQILRNPRKLWKRECAKCKAAIETTYAPERPEIVYCEQCYLSTVY